MLRSAGIAAMFAAFLIAAPAAGAQVVDQDDPYAAGGGAISSVDARDIAAAHGMMDLRKAEYEDGRWELEGRDYAGRELEMDIDGRTGEILRLERD